MSTDSPKHRAVRDPVAAFAWNVRERRHALGRTQDEVARAAGMDQGMYSRIERGTVNVTVRSAARIAFALETDVVDLLRES